MLILTRRGGESIDIGDDVVITVLAVSGDHVRIGISAPRSVPVVRAELREDVARENRAAASAEGKLGIYISKGLKLRSIVAPAS